MSCHCFVAATAGKSKEDCMASEVDHNLLVVDVSRCFGQYIKFYVELVNSTASSFTMSNAESSAIQLINYYEWIVI